MIDWWKQTGCFGLVLFCAASSAQGQGRGPTDQEIAAAIARGVDFVKSRQSDEGYWHEPAQHRLGVTALAGLALLENGVPRTAREISKAHEIVAELARESDQTYDLALAILFLARWQPQPRGEADALMQSLGERLAGGDHGGIWNYSVPRGSDQSRPASGRARRGEVRRPGRRGRMPPGPGDNSNTQFALLGLWAAGRHGFDSDEALKSIDDHFRDSQLADGRWGYHVHMPGSEAMTCAGLMGLAIAAARPSVAERQTARARGAALAADPAFQAGLRAVARDARSASNNSDHYYLWSLERVCVALGLRSLDGFDWYARGARILVDRQGDDGAWPQDRWAPQLPNTCLALLFLRKANLAFEIDRVLRLPGPREVTASNSSRAGEAGDPAGTEPADAAPQAPGAAAEPAGERGSGDVKVIVTGASQQSFPRISVQFEVKRPDGSFLLEAARDDFRVTEEGRDVNVLEFQAPQATEAIPTTLVLVVDRSLSMEEEDRIGGLKRAVGSFLEKLPQGSKVAVIAFSSEVEPLCAFTTDFAQIKSDVDAIEPNGTTRFYDAVAAALPLLEHQSGRRAVLALTDGEDTSSETATLDSVIASARRLGLPVYTLGLGTEEEIESGDLKRLATSTRGQYYPARRADQLSAIYEQIAERIRSSYTLVYESDRKLPDGTLRPVRIVYRGSQTSAGETAVFIPGMVVPAGGWSPLFLALLASLGALIVLPGALARRRAS
jgi:VWFA-related protein